MSTPKTPSMRMEQTKPEKSIEVKEEKKKSPKEEVFDRIQTILSEYNGMQSNIPLNHEYWDLVARHRTM